MSAISEAIELAMAEAKRHEQDGNLQAAHDVYSRILIQNPQYRKAKKALRALERKMGDTPALNDWELTTLLELFEREEYVRAKPMAQRLARQHPDQPMLHNLLGAILLREGQAAHARQCFEKALSIEPGFSDASSNLVQACMALEDWATARELLENILRAQPRENQETAPLQYLLGICLQSQGEMEKAVNVYQLSTRARPLFAPAHINLGSVYWAMGQTENAKTCFENALEINPDDAEANRYLGSMLKDLGRHDEAATYLAKVGLA